MIDPRSIDNDSILIERLKKDWKWNRFGKVYVWFPVSAEPLNPQKSSRDSITHRVEVVDGKFVCIHVTCWWPSNGYGPDVVMKHVQGDRVDDDPKKSEEKMLKTMSMSGDLSHTSTPPAEVGSTSGLREMASSANTIITGRTCA